MERFDVSPRVCKGKGGAPVVIKLDRPLFYAGYWYSTRKVEGLPSDIVRDYAYIANHEES